MSTDPDADPDPSAAVPEEVQEVFWTVTEEQHTVLCAIENGLTTTRQIAAHTRLENDAVRKALWELRDKELLHIRKPDHYVTEALAAAKENGEDPEFRPPKQARLTMRARQYFGWAQTYAVFHAERCEHMGLGDELDEIYRRLVRLEARERDRMRDD